ncbi:hypothetical protein Pfo_011012 [Paulownia fortunei]|nr:hypothetical protein Pfo_011012 [Paulownia fortunei]
MAKHYEKFRTDALKMAFEESENLTKENKIDLMRVTGLHMEQTSSWFNYKRARNQAQKSLLECQERETKLQKELQESMGREFELKDENQHLKQHLKIVEGVSNELMAAGRPSQLVGLAAFLSAVC